MEGLDQEFSSAGAIAGTFAVALMLAWLSHSMLFRTLGRLAARTASVIDDLMIQNCRAPSRLLFAAMASVLAAPLAPMSPPVGELVQHLLHLLLILAVAWLLVGTVRVARDFLLAQYRIDVADNLRARKIQTQSRVLVRVATAVIVVLTLAAMLMTFGPVRQVGTSILASAGIAGVIAGFAAQRSLATLIAGVQIAITQPIRLDDVVIVENEWGRVEEITLTYVVVRIWDLRRLIVPIAYFIEKPFQNWTRVSADLLATVFVYVDYTADVQLARDELLRVLQASEHWDGKVWGLQVTNASERTLELRALMSASDSDRAWKLRCEVREKLVAFLGHSRPAAFPRLRLDREVGLRTPGPIDSER